MFIWNGGIRNTNFAFMIGITFVDHRNYSCQTWRLKKFKKSMNFDRRESNPMPLENATVSLSTLNHITKKRPKILWQKPDLARSNFRLFCLRWSKWLEHRENFILCHFKRKFLLLVPSFLHLRLQQSISSIRDRLTIFMSFSLLGNLQVYDNLCIIYDWCTSHSSESFYVIFLCWKTVWLCPLLSSL